MASREVVGEPEREVRRRFLEEISPSSKGFGLVELGSADVARSESSGRLESRSIGVVQEMARRARSLDVQRRHTVAKDAPATAAQN
jgi:hypothetical protein